MADAGLPEMIAAWCDAHPDAKLVIIDTLQRVRGPVGTKSVYAEDYAFVTGLKKLADQRRVAMVLVHHLRKTSQNNRDEGDAFERISGSQGLMGAADTAMLLIRERGRREASLRVTGRDVDEATLDLCFESGVWTLQDPDRRERAAYEANPAVRAVKHFAAQTTLPGQGVRVQLEQVRDWALKSGLYVGGSTAEVGKALERVAPSLAVRDGIVVTDKRVGTKRGVEIRTLKGGSGL